MLVRRPHTITRRQPRTSRKIAGLGGVLAVLVLSAACKVERTAPDAAAPDEGPGVLMGQARAARGLLASFSDESRECLDCHQKETRAVVEAWGSSRHYRGKVGCYECHQAKPGDADAFVHHGKPIATIVSPADCGQCHTVEAKEFAASHHARAAATAGSPVHRLAEVVEGSRRLQTSAFPEGISAVLANACWACHGSEVKVLEDGKLDPATWPNAGIGRLNPDGSRGACAACHGRHRYSLAQARHPDSCAQCHLGADHPQREIYRRSKHGVAFRAHEPLMNLDNGKWVVGQDYSAAPTCATCHMSATPSLPVSHDVGMRLSWNHRGIKSVRPEAADAELGLPGARVDWEKRRKNMESVCLACHMQPDVDAFYRRYDALVDAYHVRFADPGLQLMALAKPLLKPSAFSNPVDFSWFELWHRAGRQAREAAAMQSPSQVHDGGMDQVAKLFYTELVPQLEGLARQGAASQDPAQVEAAKLLAAGLDQVLASEEHAWYLRRSPPP